MDDTKQLVSAHDCQRSVHTRLFEHRRFTKAMTRILDNIELDKVEKIRNRVFLKSVLKTHVAISHSQLLQACYAYFCTVVGIYQLFFHI